MKKLTPLFFVLLSFEAFAVIPKDYYAKAQGKHGYFLKTALKEIITEGHINRGYGALLSVYPESDADNSYDKDGTIMDMYSEDPKTSDPYVFVKKNNCGTYRGESDCYNREHLFPQSGFNKKYPMRADFFHIYPTDGYVNNRRGNLPFGIVGETTWTSLNGSKVGVNVFGKYRGQVFEPIDEFKGDIARALLYFGTRYEDQMPSFHHPMIDGSREQVYQDWFIALLKRWHRQDPVSAHEIQRNEVGYKYQGNRNPYIDHPEWVEEIWGY